MPEPIQCSCRYLVSILCLDVVCISDGHVHHRLGAANHISADHVVQDLVGIGRGVFGPAHHSGCLFVGDIARYLWFIKDKRPVQYQDNASTYGQAIHN